ncbi:MAG: tRNA (adenosine(37)-N6)-dimethylallyltransferase MiaA [Clostridiales bacterium]|nr:tRNA (adenosine(37)-N6)-dimethylallyltransferase MiaA [Clostridiales bacterium]
MEEKQEKKPLVILTGPTAVGKTSLSISLAKMIGGEIISADSMQVYRYMNIGTAKIKPEEMDGVPHFLVDVLEPDEPFHVVKFQQMARQAMEGIYKRGHIPIVVGGTGFYIQALLYDIDFDKDEGNHAYRESLQRLSDEQGSQVLVEMLRRVDPDALLTIHEHNTKRVIRALEFYHDTGKKISQHNEEQRQKSSPYRFCYFVLNDKREKIYERINKRVDKMIAEGLVPEVKSLLEKGYDPSLVSMQGLGYKELIPYLKKEQTLDEAVYTIKRDTRHFAKRQLTWFRREKEVIWVDRNLFDGKDADMLSFMYQKMEEKGMIPSKKEGGM